MSSNETPLNLFATAAVDANGNLSRGQGAKSAKRTQDGKNTGRYQLDFSPKFPDKPAIVAASTAGGRNYVRFAHLDGTGGKRAESATLDGYRIDDGASLPVDFSDTAFAAIAALSEESKALPCRMTDRKTEVKIIAGFVDRVGVHQETKIYGGGSVNEAASTAGSYVIDFPEGAFEETPWVVATPWNEYVEMRTVTVSEVSATKAKIEFRNLGGSHVGARFHFLAVGKTKAGQGTSGRLVPGVVNLKGSLVWAGSGFTSSLAKSPATYEIQLEKAFSEPPVVVAMAEHNPEEHVRQAQVHDVGTGTFRIDIYGFPKKGSTTKEEWNSSSFHFIAFAPT